MVPVKSLAKACEQKISNFYADIYCPICTVKPGIFRTMRKKSDVLHQKFYRSLDFKINFDAGFAIHFKKKQT